jgi:hypothetical protein
MELYRSTINIIMQKPNSRVDSLVEKIIKESSEILKEAEGQTDNNADEAFTLLDDARKSLQAAQAKLYMQMPSIYQQLYKNQLAVIYNHAHNAIAEVQKLAKTMHQELNQ